MERVEGNMIKHNGILVQSCAKVTDYIKKFFK